MAQNKKTKTVLVSGDVINDHQIYLGDRFSPDANEHIGTQTNTTQGGAGLLFHILEEVGLRRLKEKEENQKKAEDKRRKLPEPFKAEFGLGENVYNNLPSSQNGYSLWKPFPLDSSNEKKKVWRMAESLGYGCPGGSPFSYTEYSRPCTESPAVVVIDDGGLEFRNNSQKAAWPATITREADPALQWVVLKMSSPLGQGDLWRHLSSNYKDKLVVIVSIGDIRREEVRVSRGISWEQTALDLAEELCFNPEIMPLLKCRHLIVHFGSEGALHVDSTAKGKSFFLTFDPEHLEGEWRETVTGSNFGFMACLTAGIVDRLMQSDHPDPLHEGIRSGLSAMRTMQQSGHGDFACSKPEPPLAELAREIIAPKVGFPCIEVINPEKSDEKIRRNWTILTAFFEGVQKNPRPLFGVGRRVAIQGSQALTQVPHARFGKLYTADRNEIESLRSIKTMIRNYDKNDKGKAPLSIAVFGPPGAGKSFGIKQIAKDILDKKVPILEFNLSQLKDTGDLIDAFHQVRDSVLRGITPVVFWDEFDSREYEWLQYFLAPMQDGTFLEGQINHPIGKSVFIFAGGTSYDMYNFGPKIENEKEFKEFKLKKGPDFKSRLSGYLNVLGPNRRQLFDPDKKKRDDDLSDICYPIRRALLLRSMLGLHDKDQLKIDHGILSAIIETKLFKHGARSLEKIVLQLKRPDGVIRRSDLPSEEILTMHADAADFSAIVNRDLKFKTNADALAPFIHEFYRQLGIKEGWIKKHLNKDYNDLSNDYKEDNRAAAARIPQILDLVGLYVVQKDHGPDMQPEKIRQILDANLEMLAEAEHNDWMSHKEKNGWNYGEIREEENKIHNCLKPYVELIEQEKGKDRDSIRNFPEILRQAKYKIVETLE
jgi:hypothetical protein